VEADLRGVPQSFVQPNTGVILYRNGAKMESMVREWLRIYRNQLQEQVSPPNDQPAFKKAVFESDLRPYILPPEYNLRLDKPYFVGGNMTAKILHARPEFIDRERRKFKKKSVPRPTLHAPEEQDLIRNFGAKSLARVLTRYLLERVVRLWR
jgi:hypothetical protein